MSLSKYLFTFIAYLIEHKYKNIGPVKLEGLGDYVNEELRSGKYDDALDSLETSAKNKFTSFLNRISNKVKLTYFNKKNNITAPQQINFEQCHICMDKLANTQTSCNHWICIDCWNKLDAARNNAHAHTNANANTNAHVRCPFCRQNVTEIKIY